MKKLYVFLLIVTCVFCAGVMGRTSKAAQEDVYTARPSTDGQLYVAGKNLYAKETGKQVQLRGVSSHGLTWFPDFINENLIGQISEDWNCNLLRLAMYSDKYCEGEKEESLRLMRKGIDLAIREDMYVLVDWHIVADSNPNQHVDEAVKFFDIIASEYKDSPNLIFEICNEPNGNTVWTDVVNYADKVIPVIREHMPYSVIVVGTPEYDTDLGDPFLRSLKYKNLMYVFHFYTASHHEDLMSELTSALNHGLPVFISECGITEADGDGDINYASAVEWFTLLNKYKVSYAIWSMSDVAQTSAFFKTGFDANSKIRDEDLTDSAKWVREVIRGVDPEAIPRPGDIEEKDFWDDVSDFIALSLDNSEGTVNIKNWFFHSFISACILVPILLIVLILHFRKKRRRLAWKLKKKHYTYDDIYRHKHGKDVWSRTRIAFLVCLTVSSFFAVNYLGWRILDSIPVQYGVFPIVANVLLLIVETVGFLEAIVLFANLLGKKEYELPEIPDEAWPEVDVFIATYNEPNELLRKTIIGCTQMEYPDRSKVHIWVCDDNRRAHVRALAEELGVGYFDRPDNEGAKAGNLNHAMERTSAPYVVTFDADMIPRREFLMNTIPYFVDAELCQKDLPEEQRLHLGLLQTPQCFYTPDIFQYSLYSEKKAPNEQDFFYRSIEPSKTSTNSVIYGGSNTVLSRQALEDIGGFYTGSITEDFATGLLIESSGYVSLGLPEPLASGQTPDTYGEHIKQRTRWGRGVISTARKLKLLRRRGMTLSQKISYFSSVVYWYSPLKNLIYMISPLLFATFAVPVFYCTWLDLVIFWLPMFIMHGLSLRLISRNSISTKWSGIYENSVMPFLLLPIIKEFFGISTSVFAVTDKSGRRVAKKRNLKWMIPFIVLILLSIAGIVRMIVVFDITQIISFLILLFWIVRNLYFLLLSLFLVDGRDRDTEIVKVKEAERIRVFDADDNSDSESEGFEGITTLMTEHSITMFLDEGEFSLGESVRIRLSVRDDAYTLSGVITEVKESRQTFARTCTMEILDYGGHEDDYVAFLYDRVPTLPQSLKLDLGVLPHLWRNIVFRMMRTVRRGSGGTEV